MREYKIEVNTTIVKQLEIYNNNFMSYDIVEKTAKRIADESVENLCQQYDIEREKVKVNFYPNSREIVITYDDDGDFSLRKIEKVIKIKEI